MSPRDNIYNKRQYCSSKCAEHNNCPSQNLFYTNPSSFFKCNNGFFNMYYKCFSENEVFNENGKAALHFGNRTNSHNIYIPLKNENEEGYENYAIEAWIYPDIRLREFGYDKGYAIAIDLTGDKTSSQPPIGLFTLKGGDMMQSFIKGVGGLTGLESGEVSTPVAGAKRIMWGYSSLALFNPYKSYIIREV